MTYVDNGITPPLKWKAFSTPLVADKSKRLKDLNIYRGYHVLYEYDWMHNVHSLEWIAGYTGYDADLRDVYRVISTLTNDLLKIIESDFCDKVCLDEPIASQYILLVPLRLISVELWLSVWYYSDELYGLFRYFLHIITINRISNSR